VHFAPSGDFSYATSFPEPILMGAAFDDALIEAVATVVSTEARAYNNANRTGLDFWTPNINGYKDPRWGRGLETPGEDPFHLSSYVKSLLLGLQGGLDPKIKKIVATCKHYAAYDLENWGGNNRMRFDAKVSTQDLVEYYLPMFQQCARDSNVGSVMCSYNAVNGVPSCADPYLLQTILREHWGWTKEQQYVTSDCDAILNVAPPWHNYTKTPEEAVAVSLNAGTDLDCGTFYPQYLPGAYEQGLFKESTLDQALTRQYSALVRLGYFDPPSATPYRALGWKDVATTQATQLAEQIAAEGIVLLKNDGVLPLALGKNSKVKSVAVVGDWGNATTQMQGNYQGIAPFLHSPLYAATQTGVKVNYANGPGQKNTSSNWPDLITAAKNSDAILYFGGVDVSVEAEGMDRNNITWTSQQLSVLKQLSALGKPLIISQMGDQLDSSPLLADKGVNALIWGGYPGQSGGDALLNVITGKTSPAGRLPVTQYPGNYVSQVPMTDMSLRPSSSNPGRTYKWYNESVLPFGYGLHYTNFSVAFSGSVGKTVQLSGLTRGCRETYKDRCAFKNVPVRVENKGKVASDFVALLFMSGDHGPKPYPIKELVGYTRVKNVQPGKTQVVNIPLTLSSLSRVDENGNRVVYPGNYKLLLDVPTSAQQEWTMEGTEVVLDKWPANPHQSA
jgi:beta-D-xylosidase 4